MIVSLAELKQQLNITDDFGSADDVLINGKIEAAQNHIERLLGFRIEATYGGSGQDPVPPALKQSVQLLAAHWYENREGTLVGVTAQELPFGIWEIVREYREYSFDG
jgi:hypothetical protein